MSTAGATITGIRQSEVPVMRLPIGWPSPTVSGVLAVANGDEERGKVQRSQRSEDEQPCAATSAVQTDPAPASDTVTPVCCRIRLYEDQGRAPRAAGPDPALPLRSRRDRAVARLGTQ